MASPQALVVPTGAASPITNTAGGVFAADYFKLAAPNLSVKQRKALRIWALIGYYQSTVDYRTNPGLLINDAVTYTKGISNFDLEVALAVADWAAGTTANASTVTGDVAASIKSAKAFLEVPELTLDKIIAYFRIQLGV